MIVVVSLEPSELLLEVLAEVTLVELTLASPPPVATRSVAKVVELM